MYYRLMIGLMPMSQADAMGTAVQLNDHVTVTGTPVQLMIND